MDPEGQGDLHEYCGNTLRLTSLRGVELLFTNKMGVSDHLRPANFHETIPIREN